MLRQPAAILHRHVPGNTASWHLWQRLVAEWRSHLVVAASVIAGVKLFPDDFTITYCKLARYADTSGMFPGVGERVSGIENNERDIDCLIRRPRGALLGRKITIFCCNTHRDLCHVPFTHVCLIIRNSFMVDLDNFVVLTPFF